MSLGKSEIKNSSDADLVLNGGNVLALSTLLRHETKESTEVIVLAATVVIVPVVVFHLLQSVHSFA